MRQTELIPHLFRTEYSKIIAVLCNSFNIRHLEIAEDIASETFLKATEVWGINGVPENPAAWLYTVAKNKARDYFKRDAIFEIKVKNALRPDKSEIVQDFEFDIRTIADSQLAMIFAVCNPANSIESQICLALQILCGFSVEEIANAFLANFETIKKRLHRARTNLRDENFRITTLSENEIRIRQDTVMKTLYLLFNEGYFSKTTNQLIRKELCAEAIRLAFVLTENELTNTADANALLALFCFQSSRFDARENDKGEAIRFDDQNKDLWNVPLIEKGNQYLAKASNGNKISKYHLEAAIAYWHTTTAYKNKWNEILQLYDQLFQIEYSLVSALNRTFAFAKIFGYGEGIKEAEKLNLGGNLSYHSLLGYLYSDINREKSIFHYKQAVRLTKSKAELRTLTREINRLTDS